MQELVTILIPIIIVIVVGLIIYWVAERFSPDPLITKIIQIVLFAIVLIVLLLKLLPLLSASGAAAQELRDCRWSGDPPRILCKV